MPQKCIAVLGYGENCSERNEAWAFQAGREIALHGHTVCAGNLEGTFRHAFSGAKSVSGGTMAFLESGNTESDKALCDEVRYAESTDEKHRLIASAASGAIVIGGGMGTGRLIRKLLAQNKPVVSIRHTGGIADSLTDERVKVVSDIEEALNRLIKMP